MKKIIFGGASAILALAGFSAFKAANKTANTYYWFEINSGQSTKIVNGKPALLNDQVAFNSVATTIASGAGVCDKTNTYFCLVGFTAAQVSKAGSSFILATLAGAVTPKTAPNGTGHTQYVRGVQ